MREWVDKAQGNYAHTVQNEQQDLWNPSMPQSFFAVYWQFVLILEHRLSGPDTYYRPHLPVEAYSGGRQLVEGVSSFYTVDDQ
jgi:hypothetical protein